MWSDCLKDEEKDLIKRATHKWFPTIEMLNEASALLPFNGERFQIMGWFTKLKENGLITTKEKQNCIDMCINYLYF
jgi:hypothetical protein